MLAPSKHKYSKTLAFPDTYYELIINLLQSVELFCTYVKTQFKICQKPPKKQSAIPYEKYSGFVPKIQFNLFSPTSASAFW